MIVRLGTALVAFNNFHASQAIHIRVKEGKSKIQVTTVYNKIEIK